MDDLFPRIATPPTLRPYQRQAIDELDAAVADGARAPLLVAPTGSGKTVIAAALIRRSDGPALFLAPRRELVHQTRRALQAAGVAHGVIMAGADDTYDPDATVQVASIDTLRARLRRGLVRGLPDFQTVFIDEAHLSITAVRVELLDHWPEALRVGLTATPVRKDGRALGVIYDTLIEPVTTRSLTEAGYLAPGRYFSLSEPDLAKVRTTAGDYNQGDLDAAVNRPELVGDIVATWLARAADRRTVVFCSSIKHSIAVSERFQCAGVTAEHVDANTPTDERDMIFRRFTRGETQVLTNCFLASYGFDLPELDCVVLARPTKSLMLYLQMLGRGLRTAENKRDCLVLDHAGCVHRFGLAAEDRYWTLDGRHELASRQNGGTLDRDEPKLIDCPECAAVYTSSRRCPECGHYLQPPGRDVRTLAGELVELQIGDNDDEELDRVQFYCELRGIGVERGYKPGWAAHKFKERFAEFPPRSWNRLEPLEPSLATRRWAKSRLIAYKKMQAQAAAP